MELALHPLKPREFDFCGIVASRALQRPALLLFDIKGRRGRRVVDVDLPPYAAELTA